MLMDYQSWKGRVTAGEVEGLMSNAENDLVTVGEGELSNREIREKEGEMLGEDQVK